MAPTTEVLTKTNSIILTRKLLETKSKRVISDIEVDQAVFSLKTFAEILLKMNKKGGEL